MDFIKFVKNPESQALWHTQGSYLPAREDVADDPEIQRFWAEERDGLWLNRAFGLAQDLDPDFPGPLIGPYT